MALDASETAIVRSIMDYLRIKGHLCRRSNTGLMTGSHKGKKWAVHMGETGWPDIDIILEDGKYMGLEVKSRKGTLSESQIRIGGEIKRRNACYHVVRSIEDVQQIGL